MIYFVQVASGPIKIGHTSVDISHRVNDIQSSNYEKIVLLGVVEGDLRRESEMHNRFRRYLIRGEWFVPSPELMSFVSEETSQPSMQVIQGITRLEREDGNGLFRTPAIGTDGDKHYKFVSRTPLALRNVTAEKMSRVGKLVTSAGRFSFRVVVGPTKPLMRKHYAPFYKRAVELGYLKHRAPNYLPAGFVITEEGKDWFESLVDMPVDKLREERDKIFGKDDDE